MKTVEITSGLLLRITNIPDATEVGNSSVST